MKIRLEIIIVVLVIFVIVSTLSIINVYDRIKCDENGGRWIGIFGYGCAMDPKECREAKGVPIGCLPSSPSLSCTQGCQFG